jgi:hypothetical protein
MLPACEVYHSPPSRAKVKSAWSYKSTLIYALKAGIVNGQFSSIDKYKMEAFLEEEDEEEEGGGGGGEEDS